MAPETRDALLFSQMQEGLRHWLMESPAVSETTSLPVFALYQRVRSGGFEEASITNDHLSACCVPGIPATKLPHAGETLHPLDLFGGKKHCHAIYSRIEQVCI